MTMPQPTVRPSGPDPETVRQVVMSAAQQVRRCYRPPRLTRRARGIATSISVRYAIDGRLAQPPALLRQDGVTPDLRLEAAQLAQAAIEAITRCTPLALPQESHAGGWDEFELTFGFAAVG